MKLNLSVEGRVLSSVFVDASRAGDEYYLKAFRRLLTIRHYKKLATINKKPFFFIEHGAEASRKGYEFRAG